MKAAKMLEYIKGCKEKNLLPEISVNGCRFDVHAEPEKDGVIDLILVSCIPIAPASGNYHVGDNRDDKNYPACWIYPECKGKLTFSLVPMSQLQKDVEPPNNT